MARITEPRPGEPIRLIYTDSGLPRYKCVLDVGVRENGRRRQIARTFKTLREARGFVTRTRADIADGAFTAPDSTTFDALCDQWLSAQRHLRKVTAANYSLSLKSVRRRWAGRKAQSLTRSDVESLVSWLSKQGGRRGQGLSRQSVVYALGNVSRVLAFGVKAGVLRSNVAAGVKPPRKQRGDKRPAAVWEPNELLTFRATADRHELAAAWRLTMCGLRRSELLGLEWKHIDLDAGVLTIEQARVLVDGHAWTLDDPKSDASWRDVPFEAMHPGTVALLRSLKASQAADKLAAGGAYEDSPFVFVDVLGRPLRHEAYSKAFRRLCGEAGVPSVHLHSVRHTTATIMHRQGVAPADAAALLGHETTLHLSTYVTSTDRGTTAAAAAFGEGLAAGS